MVVYTDKITSMGKGTFFSRNIFLKPFFIFALSLLVYLFYFLGVNPGYYSRDVLTRLHDFTYLNNLFGDFYYILPEEISVSFFYNIYILIFYLVTENLVALGLFQIVLFSVINTYCWIVLSKFSKAKIAWIVTLLMIFSPLNGIMPMWYHRSSLFAPLVCLNLMLLYKFSKVRRFKRLERVVFLINLLFVAFLRIDGIIISLASLSIYILKARYQKRIKVGIFAGFILTLTIYTLTPVLYSHPRPYIKLPLVHQIRRIHQSIGSEFSDKDLEVLKPIARSESDRKLWLETKEYLDNSVFNDCYDVPQKQLNDFIQWSCLFVSKNFFHFIKTQTQVFFASSLLGSPLAHYFHTNDMHKNKEYYIEIRKKNDIGDRPYIEFPGNIVRFILEFGHCNFLESPKAFFVACIFGTSIPFVFIFVYFVIAFKRNRNVLIPLIPLLLYSIFMFLCQPKPKGWYWYWLAYSYYFIVFGLGYKIISEKKQRTRQ